MGKELAPRVAKKAKQVLKSNGKAKSLEHFWKGAASARPARPIGAPTSANSKGPLPPSKWPAGCAVSKNGRTPGRPFWLPEDWAVGVKTTCRTFLPCFIGPNKKVFYHKPDLEKYLGYTIGPEATKEGAIKWATERIATGTQWNGKKVETPDDEKLLKELTKEEKALLPPVSSFHVGVVSARRASEIHGVKDIVAVEVALRASGVTPTWYVDEKSLEDYRALGLNAVVGGKLTPARNMALDDAAKAGKLCVQVSDDISRWQYWNTTKVIKGDLSAANAFSSTCRKQGLCLDVSPATAMRFMAAKMRAIGAKLGGVYPQANVARAFSQPPTTTEHFILGDFFVADKSPIRFDEAMTLKEDYDYTCGHLSEHGKVLRFNRMVIVVKHSTNAGGAVAVRDSAGVKEQQNIAVLMKKWPGAFRKHPHRAHEVVLQWSRKVKEELKSKPRELKRKASACSDDGAASQARQARPSAALEKAGLPLQAVLKLTPKGEAATGFVAVRCRAVNGIKVCEALQLFYRDGAGEKKAYKLADLKYDLGLGRLTMGGAGGKAASENLQANHWAVNKPVPKKAKKAGA